MGKAGFIDKFLNKEWYRCVFIYKNNLFDIVDLKPDENRTIQFNKKRYYIEPECVYRKGNISLIFYYVENPNPVRVEHKKNYVKGIPISSDTFNEIINSKVIKEVINLDSDKNIILIVLGILCLLVLINIGISTGYINLTPAANASVAVNATNSTHFIPMK